MKGTKKKRLELKEDSMQEITSDGDEFSLTDEQLLKLGKVGVFIEEVFGNPRDIEWAFYEVSLVICTQVVSPQMKFGIFTFLDV